MRTFIVLVAMVVAGSAQAANCKGRPAIYAADNGFIIKIVDSGYDSANGEMVYKGVQPISGPPFFIHGKNVMNMQINVQTSPSKSVVMGRGTNNLPNGMIGRIDMGPTGPMERYLPNFNLGFIRCE